MARKAEVTLSFSVRKLDAIRKIIICVRNELTIIRLFEICILFLQLTQRGP